MKHLGTWMEPSSRSASCWPTLLLGSGKFSSCISILSQRKCGNECIPGTEEEDGASIVCDSILYLMLQDGDLIECLVTGYLYHPVGMRRMNLLSYSQRIWYCRSKISITHGRPTQAAWSNSVMGMGLVGLRITSWVSKSVDRYLVL